jgi:hypothetical protein
MKIVFVLLLLIGMNCFGQISGNLNSLGQTATASQTLTPALQLLITFSNCVQTAWSTNPLNLWAGASFSCTVTSNQPAPLNSVFTVTMSVIQPTSPSGVQAAVVSVSPSPVVIPSGQSSAVFSVSGR